MPLSQDDVVEIALLTGVSEKDVRDIEVIVGANRASIIHEAHALSFERRSANRKPPSMS